MGMDIRLPIGVLFTLLGLLLAVFGLFSSGQIYQVSLGIDINLIWGLVLLAFGIVMLLLAKRSARLEVKTDGAGQAETLNSRARVEG